MNTLKANTHILRISVSPNWIYQSKLNDEELVSPRIDLIALPLREELTGLTR